VDRPRAPHLLRRRGHRQRLPLQPRSRPPHLHRRHPPQGPDRRFLGEHHAGERELDRADSRRRRRREPVHRARRRRHARVHPPRELRPGHCRRRDHLRRGIQPHPRVPTRPGLADPRRGIPRCDRVLHHPDVVAGSAHVKQPDLFAGHEPPAAPPDPDPADAGLSPGAPLAARMRPRSLDEFVGQEHLLAPGRALRELIEKDVPGSVILWGPPGSGKTTIARIIAERTRAAFVPFSAVTEGVARVREVIREADARLRAPGRRPILSCDEIHRFNKAQQDAFLPHVEAGTISLIGATTENPSFEVIGPLLSRARVFALAPLQPQHLEVILRRALMDAERGLGDWGLEVDDNALALLAAAADGDARRALNALEAAATLAGRGGRITRDVVREALQHRFSRYDKAGEEHYNMLSAYHKALRGSDPDGALYWMARMIEAGEDPMVLFR